MKVAIFAPSGLSDDWLRWATQIGVDYIDSPPIPGLREQGYPDMDKLLKLERMVRSWGLRINRVTLPSTPKFMLGQPGGEEEIDNVCKTIKCLGEARIPIGRPVFLESMDSPPIGTTHAAEHRGGYVMRAFDLELRKRQLAERPPTERITLEEHWSRCKEVYGRILPLAEESGVKLALHPSDVPLPEAPFSSLGYHRVLDAFPSEKNGLLYCVGTRHEAGGTQLVLDEINHYGRKGKIFEVHFRNVRGSLATAGGFEEVLLDDGDMNMFEIIRELDRVGYDGALNPDHMPLLAGDTPDHRMAWSYSVGYVKALLAALATLP